MNHYNIHLGSCDFERLGGGILLTSCICIDNGDAIEEQFQCKPLNYSNCFELCLYAILCYLQCVIDGLSRLSSDGSVSNMDVSIALMLHPDL